MYKAEKEKKDIFSFIALALKKCKVTRYNYGEKF